MAADDSVHPGNGADATELESRCEADPPPPTTSDLLFEYLSRTDVECPRCGYSLRHLRSEQCPECGDRLMLAVALVEPRLGSFITALVAWSLGLGGSVLLGLIAATEAPAEWWTEPVAVVLLVLFGVSATGLVAMLCCRRQYRRAPRNAQRTLAAASCAIVLILWWLIVTWFE